MRLMAFCIRNFRSIVDTGWCNLSKDNITALIGQNESGKTSVLEALNAFYTDNLESDYLRSDETLPQIACSFEVTQSDVIKLFQGLQLPEGFSDVLIKHENKININRVWAEGKNSNLELEQKQIGELFSKVDSPKKELTAPPTPNVSALATATTKIATALAPTSVLAIPSQKVSVPVVQTPVTSTQVNLESTTEQVSEQPAKESQEEKKQPSISAKKFIDKIMESIPEFSYFEDFSALLPNVIDVADLVNKKTKVEGYLAALNFLKIAEINVADLANKETRIVQNRIDRINKGITAGFLEFWKQEIGRSNKISIEFQLRNHDAEDAETAGKPYLAFWIKDGEESLYPKQRSKGVRWFLSFYLQLRASAMGAGDSLRIFLIDEPGGSLHARAQEEVIKVFEENKEKIQIIYTTHSPYLISIKTLYRLLAVQRSDVEDERSQTKIIDVHSFNAASKDTLFPLYTLMGADLSTQQVVHKMNNVLLEEVSAFYYLSAFWKLVNSKKEVHFLPATGVNKLPLLAYLFTGWGLDFISVVDDEKSGRAVFKVLKENLFGNNEDLAKKKLLKIKDKHGIEDIFSNTDFKKFVLDDAGLTISAENSKFMKEASKPKGITALEFMLKVNEDKIKLTEFETSTQENIKGLVGSIEAMLT